MLLPSCPGDMFLNQSLREQSEAGTDGQRQTENKGETNLKPGVEGDCCCGRAGQKRAQVIGLGRYMKVSSEVILVLLCNGTRSDSARKQVLLTLPQTIPSAAMPRSRLRLFIGDMTKQKVATPKTRSFMSYKSYVMNNRLVQLHYMGTNHESEPPGKRSSVA